MYTKHINALRLMDELILANNAETRDKLFSFLVDNFPGPAAEKTDALREEIAACISFLDSTYPRGCSEIETLVRSIPPVILDSVWPIAIARFVIRDSGMVGGLVQCKPFCRFAMKYVRIIV